MSYFTPPTTLAAAPATSPQTLRFLPSHGHPGEIPLSGILNPAGTKAFTLGPTRLARHDLATLTCEQSATLGISAPWALSITSASLEALGYSSTILACDGTYLYLAALDSTNILARIYRYTAADLSLAPTTLEVPAVNASRTAVNAASLLIHDGFLYALVSEIATSSKSYLTKISLSTFTVTAQTPAESSLTTGNALNLRMGCAHEGFIYFTNAYSPASLVKVDADTLLAAATITPSVTTNTSTTYPPVLHDGKIYLSTNAYLLIHNPDDATTVYKRIPSSGLVPLHNLDPEHPYFYFTNATYASLDRLNPLTLTPESSGRSLQVPMGTNASLYLLNKNVLYTLNSKALAADNAAVTDPTYPAGYWQTLSL